MLRYNENNLLIQTQFSDVRLTQNAHYEIIVDSPFDCILENICPGAKFLHFYQPYIDSIPASDKL